MARTTLLDTRTVNYQELIGNGRAYFVPPYQRDYSWRKEQWEDLWNDIVDTRSSTSGPHYMGALVVEARSDRKFVVIDGQQRLATLSSLALAIIDALLKLTSSGVEPKENEARARELRNRFIGERDPASLVESSRLNLNDTDNGFYQDYLVQLVEPSNPRGLPPSSNLLWECFRFFGRRIQDLEDARHDGQVLASLMSETVARRLVFILITVDDALNAYTVFETLNARGLELTTTDLLKNHIFATASEVDRPGMLRRWQRMADTVGMRRVPDLLRYHLLCEEPHVRRRRLFKLVRERYTSPRKVLDLLRVLERRAELFSAMLDPSHEYWMDAANARPWVTELKLFRVTQMMPLLFVVWENWSREDFVRTLKLVSVVAFRYTVVSRLNPNELEPAYHRASKAVADGTATGPRELFEELRPIYVPDEQMVNAFTYLTIPARGPRKRLVKHILARLEEDASGKRCDAERDPGTIEHVLPENPGSEWEEEFPHATRPGAANRIGNLTLLEANLNRAIGNQNYERKLAEYGKSKYAITKAITTIAPEEWTLAFLDERQQHLARRAAHLWRADFAKS